MTLNFEEHLREKYGPMLDKLRDEHFETEELAQVLRAGEAFLAAQAVANGDGTPQRPVIVTLGIRARGLETTVWIYPGDGKDCGTEPTRHVRAESQDASKTLWDIVQTCREDDTGVDTRRRACPELKTGN